jgi:hypothetical protein
MIFFFTVGILSKEIESSHFFQYPIINTYLASNWFDPLESVN